MERPILQRGRSPWVADHHRGARYGRLSTGVFELLVHIADPQSPKSTRLTLEVDVLSVAICPSGLPVTPIVATRWESTREYAGKMGIGPGFAGAFWDACLPHGPLVPLKQEDRGEGLRRLHVQERRSPTSRTAPPELRGPERDGGGGDVAVPVARHRPHQEGLVADRPQEAIGGVRRVAVRVPIVWGAPVDSVRDLVGKIELGGGRLRADAKLQVHVRGAARVPTRIDRSESDGPAGLRELCAPHKRFVVHRLDVRRGDGGAPLAGGDAGRIALPDVPGGFLGRPA